MVSRTGQAAGSTRDASNMGCGSPLTRSPGRGSWVVPWVCYDSPTWTASLASSWGWGPASSLCSCVSVGTKQSPLGLKFSSFPVSSPAKMGTNPHWRGFLECGTSKPHRGLTLPRPKLPGSPAQSQAPDSPIPLPNSWDATTAVPRGYSRWKCVPCRQPAPGARGSVGTGTQSGMGRHGTGWGMEQGKALAQGTASSGM